MKRLREGGDNLQGGNDENEMTQIWSRRQKRRALGCSDDLILGSSALSLSLSLSLSVHFPFELSFSLFRCVSPGK